MPVFLVSVSTLWCGYGVLNIGTIGASCRLKIMERLSISGDVCTREAAHAKDSKQLTKSDLQVTQKEKDGVKGSNFCGLVERKPFKKLKV